MAKSKVKTKTKAKIKTKTDESCHPYSISIAVENKDRLDELIRLCKERSLFYTVHDYDE